MWTTDLALWQRMLTTNLTAAFLLSRPAAPHEERGRLVHVAAWAAVKPFPGAAAYRGQVRLLGLINAGARTERFRCDRQRVAAATIDTCQPCRHARRRSATWARPASIAEHCCFSRPTSQPNQQGYRADRRIAGTRPLEGGCCDGSLVGTHQSVIERRASLDWDRAGDLKRVQARHGSSEREASCLFRNGSVC